MPNKPISELSPVSTITSNDSFVLEQNSRAMRLTGGTLISWLVSKLNGHGGVSTYTISYTTSTSGSGTPPSSGWQSSIPATPIGHYLWTRTITTFADTTNAVSYSVSRNGEDGFDLRLSVSASSNSTVTINNEKITSNHYVRQETSTIPGDITWTTNNGSIKLVSASGSIPSMVLTLYKVQ